MSPHCHSRPSAQREGKARRALRAVFVESAAARGAACGHPRGVYRAKRVFRRRARAPDGSPSLASL